MKKNSNTFPLFSLQSAGLFLMRWGLACAVLLGGYAAGYAAEGQGSKTRNLIGCCTGASGMEAMAAAGFDYAEITISEVVKLDDAGVEALRQKAEKLKLPIKAGVNFYPADIKLTGPAIDTRKQMEYATNVLRRLSQLGVDTVVLGSGGARRVPEGFDKQQAMTQLEDFCRRIAPVAGQFKITIVLEPLRSLECNILNTAKEALALAKKVNCPEIKILVDLYHMDGEKEDPAIIIEAGDYLRHVHVANPKGRVIPSDVNEYPYQPFFQALIKAGYAGKVSLEGKKADMAKEGPVAVKLLRQLLEK